MGKVARDDASFRLITIFSISFSKATPISTKVGRYQPDDSLLAFLKGL